MRYIIQKSPITEKYYIWDSFEQKLTTTSGYDIILEIVADKYAIVGTKDFYNIDYRYYLTYRYRLIDINGREVFDQDFKFIYPNDSEIYCKIDNLPINQLTYLGHYKWNQQDHIYLSKYPFYYFDDKTAITKGEKWEDTTDLLFSKFGHIYHVLDNQGNVLREERISNKEPILKKLFRSYQNTVQRNNVYINILDDFIDKKWAHINEITVHTNNNYINLCSIQVNEKIRLTNVHLGFAWNKFLLIYNDDKEYNRSYYNDRKIITRANNCIAILDDSFKLLYYSSEGFKVNTRVFNNCIVIGEDYIMDYNGKLYNIPKDIIFSNDTCDCLGYLKIEEEGNWGYMNNQGKIVIPPIFPKDKQISIDEDAANEAWKEYQNYAANSISDAFEGDSDAHWNVD